MAAKPKAKAKAKPKPKAKSKPKREAASAEEREMTEAIAGMAQVLQCPVIAAAEHAEFCSEAAFDSDTRARVAMVALELYARPGPIETAVCAILEDFRDTMERHTRELGELADRFAQFDDHSIAHAHIEVQDMPIGVIAEAMFGDQVYEDDASE